MARYGRFLQPIARRLLSGVTRFERMAFEQRIQSAYAPWLTDPTACATAHELKDDARAAYHMLRSFPATLTRAVLDAGMLDRSPSSGHVIASSVAITAFVRNLLRAP